MSIEQQNQIRELQERVSLLELAVQKLVTGEPEKPTLRDIAVQQESRKTLSIPKKANG